MVRHLVDTSVMIDYLRGNPLTIQRLDALRNGNVIAMADPVVMELLAGARGLGAVRLELLLETLPLLSIDARLDFRQAASIQRHARSSGHTIRSLIDCLIAAIALRHKDVVLIHNDVDFERIAQVAPLRQERWAG